ncbi:platelet glycoprotein Ib alpha chain-like [Hyperolius riggenbachi]|uniref:platelet glycoprotein Ib alpha chain-like n=1 Tax=Hyperolius riggenbachi TaxID=752182 RepID=UPI0035A3C35C
MAIMNLVLPYMLVGLLFASKVFSQSSCVTKKDKNMQETSCVHLGLTDVPLKEIPPDTAVLVLSFNALKAVSTSSFKNMRKLVRLDLSDNSLTSFQVDFPVMLQELILANNSLKSVPDLSRLSSLTKLDLSNNHISSLQDTDFKGLKKLKSLELQKNRIDSVSEKAFRDLSSLNHLDLSHNQLWQLPNVLISELVQLGSFSLMGNRLTNIPDSFFDGLDSLEKVYLDKNPWICNCALHYFKEWLVDNAYNVYHLANGIPVNDELSVVCAGGTPLYNYHMDTCLGNEGGGGHKNIMLKLPNVLKDNSLVSEFPIIMEETSTVPNSETIPNASIDTWVITIAVVMDKLYS